MRAAGTILRPIEDQGCRITSIICLTIFNSKVEKDIELVMNLKITFIIKDRG